MKCRYKFENITEIPPAPFCFRERYNGMKKVLMDTFFGPVDVGVYSPSVQNTLYLMATAVLNRSFSDNDVYPFPMLMFTSLI
jgi:urate oxidase